MGVISFRRNMHFFYRLVIPLVCLVIVVFGESTSFAQRSGSVGHDIVVGIAPITVLAVSGDPQPFLTGQDVRSTGRVIDDRTTSYRLTTNIESVVLRAEIDAPMPPGTRLSLTAEPSRGIGLGAQDITEASQPVDLVVSIGQGIENDSVLSYRVHIDSSLSKLDIQKRTVTVSLCDPDESQCSRAFQSIVFGIEPPG